MPGVVGDAGVLALCNSEADHSFNFISGSSPRMDRLPICRRDAGYNASSSFFRLHFSMVSALRPTRHHCLPASSVSETITVHVAPDSGNGHWTHVIYRRLHLSPDSLKILVTGYYGDGEDGLVDLSCRVGIEYHSSPPVVCPPFTKFYTLSVRLIDCGTGHRCRSVQID